MLKNKHNDKIINYLKMKLILRVKLIKIRNIFLFMVIELYKTRLESTFQNTFKVMTVFPSKTPSN